MKRPPRTARNKMMDLLALRDHSEREIRNKLKKKEFTPEEINSAIDYGRAHGWLPDSEDRQLKLSLQFAEGLHKKKKGIIFINSYLRTKGLPPVPVDDEREFEKAHALLKLKIKNKAPQTKKDLAKLSLFLQARGFDSNTIRASLKQIRLSF